MYVRDGGSMEQPNKGADLTSELICRFRSGDEASFDELLLRYQPLIESLVTKFSGEEQQTSREDLRQEAAVAFYRSVLSYDVAQNDVEFGLYAKICLSNALISKLRARRNPIEELLDGSEREIELAGEREDPAERLLEEERLSALYAVIRENLSEFEYRVWNLYLSGRTAKEIGAVVGRDEKSISNAIYRIRKKLRVALG